jgi:hypothetical protein
MPEEVGQALTIQLQHRRVRMACRHHGIGRIHRRVAAAAIIVRCGRRILEWLSACRSDTCWTGVVELQDSGVHMKAFPLVTMLLATSLFASPVFACDCSLMPVRLALGSNDLVFSGVVTSVRLTQQQADGDGLTIVELSVQKSWKGAPMPLVRLHFHHNEAACEGYAFAVGQRYVVFAKRNMPGFSERYGMQSTVTYGVTLCGGTSSQTNPLTRERERQLDALSSR